MAVPVLVPKLGPTMVGGILAEWYFPDGASVARGEPVFRLECDYVAIEVEAASPGVLRHQTGDGDICRPGSIAAVILAPGERMPDSAPDDFGDPAPIVSSRPDRARPDDEEVIDWTQRPAAPADPAPEAEADYEPVPLYRHTESAPESGGHTVFEQAAVPDLDETAYIESARVPEARPPEHHVHLPADRSHEPAAEAAKAWLAWAVDVPSPVEPDEAASDTEQGPPAEDAPLDPAMTSGEAPHQPPFASSEASHSAPDEPTHPEPAHPDHPWAGVPPVEPVFELRRPSPPEAQSPADDAAPQTRPMSRAAFWSGEITRQSPVEESGPAPGTVQPVPFAGAEAGIPVWPGQARAAAREPSPGEPEASAPAEAEEASPEEATPGPVTPPVAEPVSASVPAFLQAGRTAPVLFVRTSANVSEAAKMRAQLAREWRSVGLQPGDEDIVVRAVAHAIRESPAFAGFDDAIGLCTLEEEGTALRILHDAGTRQFRDAVAAFAAQEPSTEGDPPCACTVTSLGDFSLDEGSPQLRPGQVIAITMGAVRPAAAFHGDRFEQVPTMTLTLAYDAGFLHEGAAVRLLARIRDLVEAPYALLVA